MYEEGSLLHRGRRIDVPLDTPSKTKYDQIRQCPLHSPPCEATIARPSLEISAIMRGKLIRISLAKSPIRAEAYEHERTHYRPY